MTSPGQGQRKAAPGRPLWSTILLIVLAVAFYVATQKGWIGKKPAPAGSAPTASNSQSDRSAPTGSPRDDYNSRNTPAAPSSTPDTSRSQSPRTNSPGSGVKPSGSTAVDNASLIKAFESQKSYQIITGTGRVVKILPDDLETGDGSGQHQKFLVEVNRDLTIRLVNNIDLGFSRVPVKEGDTVSFKGEYIYNEKGGTVHWTHHDPRGRHADGWVELNGKKYD